MQVRIQSYPPLGELTNLPSGPTQLTVILEVPRSQTQHLWEVELWRSADGSNWAGQRTRLCDYEPTTYRLASPSVATLHYATILDISSDARFTWKLRRNASESWTWAKDVYGYEDGLIVVTKVGALADAGEKLPLPGLAEGWKTSERLSQSPGTRLWALNDEVAPSNSDQSSIKSAVIGKPWGAFLRWFALVRHNSSWLGPRHGKLDVHLDQDAIMCAFQNSRGQHVVVLAVTTDNLVESVLRSTESGGLELHARSDSTTKADATVLVSLGPSLDGALASVVYEARKLADPYANLDAVSCDSKSTPIEEASDKVKPLWREEWADGLGYCTWNALGPRITDHSLHHALASLSDNGVKISNLIIDDGWQAVTHDHVRGWKTFEADSQAFPHGLKCTVSKLRANFPEIDHIAVWHAIHGYWGGISADDNIAQEYETVEVECSGPYNQKMNVVGKEDVGRFYQDFYRFLAEAGIDSVKADVQHVLDCIVDTKHRRDLIAPYLDAWSSSTLRHFGARAISCMSQFPQGIFRSHIRQNHTAFVVRNSDDYFPNEPTSHTWHLWANAHNSLFTRYLNVVPDWDMFQTKHEYAGFHAAARCVSGGPIYITDVPGEHDMSLIKSMTGVTARGKTVVFRPSVVGRSVSAFVGFDEGRLLKIGSYHGSSGTGSPILGVFNTSTRPLAEIVPLSTFTGAVPTLDYVVRSYNTGKVSPRLKCGDQNDILSVSLEIRGYDILTATPLALFPGDRQRHIWVGNMGLLGKMTGCAALVSTEMRKLENKRLVIQTSVKAFGILGIWISMLPMMSIDDDFMITLQEEPVPRHTVRQSGSSNKVLEIDLETAWKELDLKSRWSNEIGVKIYFST